MNFSKKINLFKYLFSNEIPLKFLFSRKLTFPHPVGIVISKSAVIGKNVAIFSNVTIGGKKDGNVTHYPVIGDNVTIFTGAVIVGDIKIGQGCVIGANTTITKDIPDNSIVYNKVELIIKNKENPYGS